MSSTSFELRYFECNLDFSEAKTRYMYAVFLKKKSQFRKVFKMRRILDTTTFEFFLAEIRLLLLEQHWLEFSDINYKKAIFGRKHVMSEEIQKIPFF